MFCAYVQHCNKDLHKSIMYIKKYRHSLKSRVRRGYTKNQREKQTSDVAWPLVCHFWFSDLRSCISLNESNQYFSSEKIQSHQRQITQKSTVPWLHPDQGTWFEATWKTGSAGYPLTSTDALSGGLKRSWRTRMVDGSSDIHSIEKTTGLESVFVATSLDWYTLNILF